MRDRPLPRSAPLLPGALLGHIALLAAAITIVTLGWYATRVAQGVPADVVRTETFTLLAVCEWMNVLGCRARTRSAFRTPLRRNPWLLAGLGVEVLLQIAVVQWTPLGAAFRSSRRCAMGGDRARRQRRADRRRVAQSRRAPSRDVLTRR